METFPSYVKIGMEGYNEKRESALLRSDMESGPTKQAKIKSAVLVTRHAKLLFRTNAEYQSFINWFSVNINEGADWFTWTDPTSLTVKQARFVSGGLDAAPLGNASGPWTASANIETWG